MIPNNPYNNRPKAPKERLTTREKPFVWKYERVIDVAHGELFNQFSRMVRPRQFYDQVGAPAVQQAAAEQLTPVVPTEPYQSVSMPQANGVLDIDAIRQRIAQQQERADA